MANECGLVSEDRRRIFWATQPNTAVVSNCGVDCGVPGLKLVEVEDAGTCIRCQVVGTESQLPDPDREQFVTISNTGWVLGLVLNIMQTSGRVLDKPCGVRPGAAGGHWSESFAGSGASFGNLLHTIQDGYKMSDLVKLASQYAKMAAQKLVTYGVANNVDVTTTYVGSGVVSIEIIVYGMNGLAQNVSISGTVVNNYWVWQS